MKGKVDPVLFYEKRIEFHELGLDDRNNMLFDILRFQQIDHTKRYFICGIDGCVKCLGNILGLSFQTIYNRLKDLETGIFNFKSKPKNLERKKDSKSEIALAWMEDFFYYGGS